jgi:hypothetical protein
MLEAQTPVPGTRHSFVGDRSVILGDFLQLKAALRAALWEQEPNRDVLKVLDRAADDNDLYRCTDSRRLRGS